MTTTQTIIQTIGTRGEGEWATVSVEDGTYYVHVFDGWACTEQMRFNGVQAEMWAEHCAQAISEDLATR